MEDNFTIALNPERCYDGKVVFYPYKFYPYELSLNIQAKYCVVENSMPPQWITKFEGIVYRNRDCTTLHKITAFSYEECYQSCMEFIKGELDASAVLKPRTIE